MKTEKVIKKLKFHFENKFYCRITRKKGKFIGYSTGFVVGLSDSFVIIQETDDFRILGFNVFPIKSIIHVRYNKNLSLIHI